MRTRNIYLLAVTFPLATLVFSFCSVHGQTLLLSDQMTTGSGWTYSHLGGTNAPGGGDTSEADFGFDYSQFGIPEAPNTDVGDTSTSGLRLATNTTGFFGGESIAAVYEDADFTGQYTIQVDMWLNWSALEGGVGLGTTEHGGVFAGFDTSAAQATVDTGFSGAGIRLSTDGDTTNDDYVLHKNRTALDTNSGQYSVTDFGFGNQFGFDETDVNANPANGELINLPALFPSFDIEAATGGLNGAGTQTEGAAGFQWITITAEVDTDALGNGTDSTTGLATFYVENAATGESFRLGTIDNSIVDEDTEEVPVSMSGALGLMWHDRFNGGPSTPQHGFGIFDNVRVYDGFLMEANPDTEPDGDVDGADFLEIQRTDLSLISPWEEQYGTGVSPVIAASAVPEPTTGILSLLGILCFSARRSRIS